MKKAKAAHDKWARQEENRALWTRNKYSKQNPADSASNLRVVQTAKAPQKKMTDLSPAQHKEVAEILQKDPEHRGRLDAINAQADPTTFPTDWKERCAFEEMQKRKYKDAVQLPIGAKASGASRNDDVWEPARSSTYISCSSGVTQPAGTKIPSVIFEPVVQGVLGKLMHDVEKCGKGTSQEF